MQLKLILIYTVLAILSWANLAKANVSGIEDQIRSYAIEVGVDPTIAVAIAMTESSLNPDAIGSAGEVGLYQIMPQFYKEFSLANLKKTHINIVVGLNHILNAMQRCKHKKQFTWLVCYNLGITAASKLKRPKRFEYYTRVMRAYRELGGTYDSN